MGNFFSFCSSLVDINLKEYFKAIFAFCLQYTKYSKTGWKNKISVFPSGPWYSSNGYHNVLLTQEKVRILI